MTDKQCSQKTAEIIPYKDKKISLYNLIGNLQLFAQRESVISSFIKKVSEKFASKKKEIKPLEDKLTAIGIYELSNKLSNACKKGRKSRKSNKY